jgi:hypothetical protein
LRCIVERSVTNRLASCGTVECPPAAISSRMTNCDDRNPLGSRVRSKRCVIARDAVRRLLQAQAAAAIA